MVPGVSSPLLQEEHQTRYRLARRFCRGKKVLDLGAGTVYGSAIIAPVSSAVVALELHFPTLQYALRRYRQKKIHAINASGEKLPLKDNSFDIVVLYEVLEHVEKAGVLLDEAGRVLGKDGLLILSTPNRSVLQPSETSPFHVKEYDSEELSRLLSRHFRKVALFEQAFAGAMNFSRIDSLAPGGKFLIAFCSDGDLPVLKSRYTYTVEAVDGCLNEEIRLRENEIRRLEADIEEQRKWRTSLQEELAAAYDSLQAYQKENAQRLQSLESLLEEHDRLRRYSEREASLRDSEILRLQELLRKFEDQQATAEAAISVRDAEIARLQSLLDEQMTWNDEQKREVSVRDEEIRRISALLEQQADWYSAQEAAILERDREIQRLQELLAEQSAGLQKLGQEVVVYGEAVESYRQEAQKLAGQNQELLRCLAERSAQLEELASWGRRQENDLRIRDEEILRLQKLLHEQTRWALSLKQRLEDKD